MTDACALGCPRSRLPDHGGRHEDRNRHRRFRDLAAPLHGAVMESRHITLDLGNVSLSETSGPCYIDMRPAPVHYTNNIYRMWYGTGSS